jgi:tetratricopeptide (TPR) repeat protein
MDRIAVDAYLTHLRIHQPQGSESDLSLFEVDYALEAMQYDRAEKLLGNLNPGYLPVQVRMAKLALEQGKSSQAREQASQVLFQAHEGKNEEIELDALLILAQAQRRLGEMVPGLISTERALRLAQRLISPIHMVNALLAQGWIMIRQGRYSEALTIFQRAQSQSQESGLRGELAKVLYGISLVKIYMGDFLKAKETLQETLGIWRDLGLVEMEVRALTRLSHISGQLGENEEALYTLELARQIGARLNDPLVNARNQYNLAAAMPYHNEDQVDSAIALAENALRVFRSQKQPGWEAATLATLGYNLWVAGNFERANEIIKEAFILHKKLGEVGVLPELMAYQGLALLGLDRLEEAVECTRGALLALVQSNVDNDIISEIYYAHAAVLDELGEDEEAQEYFTRAYQNLLKYAQQLDDDTARQAFFQRDPTVRRLMKVVYQREIAPRPDAGVVHRWVRSRTGEPIRVAWTYDAGPPDRAYKRSRGAVGLRRTRLTRILRESTAQGASPTIKQLADTLGVSTRTIKRDLAEIRAHDNNED